MAAYAFFFLFIGFAGLGVARYTLVNSIDRSIIPPLRQEPKSHHEEYLLGLLVNVTIFVPFIASYLITPMFVSRYMIPASLGLFILIAAGIRYLMQNRLSLVILAVLLVSVLIFPLIGYYSTSHKEQWEDVSSRIEANADTDDLVVIGPAYSDPDPSKDYEYAESLGVVDPSMDTRQPFAYYFDRDDVTVSPVTPTVSNDDIRTMVDGREEVWVVFSHMDAEERQRILEVIEETHERVEHEDSYGGSVTGGQLELFYYERGNSNDEEPVARSRVR